MSSIEPTGLSDLGETRRTAYCGDLRATDAGKKITVMGWVNSRRDLGDLIFIDVRDRTGIVQVVSDAGRSPESYATADKARSEYVLAVTGTVQLRRPGSENPDMPTGAIEILSESILILNTAKTPPFYIRDDAGADELLRMKYRYLDLRRPVMQKGLEMYHKVSMAVRDYLSEHGFWDIQTPMMTRSTPEGARDYLVPSRLEHGKFYALAQSPQLFKQLLMVGGIDKYFQIVKCFRDEDLRADRQPEFTQIDIEMSFIGEEDVWALVEGMMKDLWRRVMGMEIRTPFPRLTYQEAMSRFGSDKPDTRFGMEIKDVTSLLASSEFGVFKTTAEQGGTIRAIAVPGQAGISRQEIDNITTKAKSMGAKGLVTIAYLPGDIKSPVKKYLSEEEIRGIAEATGAKDGDLVLMVADGFDTAVSVLGRLRLDFGHKLGLIPKDKYDFLWITEFPLLKRNDETGEWEAAHHPFTSPMASDVAKIRPDITDEEKGQIRARMYDLVMNGVELASGSIRIHRRDLQEKVFALLGMSESEARSRFYFLLDAFEYGAPPHGGIAFGLDRLVMLMAGLDTIREVIAFPKTASATDPMTEAPAAVDRHQLEELGLAPKKVETGDR
ncbi:MAG: aspartate--tRNA ligase [Bacillota bacterium]